MTEEKLVLPGEQLSTSEELLPGDGTYEDEGIIRAAIIGTYYVDNKNRTAIVKPVTSVPVVLKKGDIVLGEVRSARNSMIIADVFHVVGKNRSVSGDTNATIHASEISKGYVKDAATELKPGDIFRARIFQVKPSIQLETKDDQYGVIKALCSRCRHTLEKKGPGLECNICGNKERRKIANDYDTLNIEKL